MLGFTRRMLTLITGATVLTSACSASHQASQLPGDDAAGAVAAGGSTGTAGGSENGGQAARAAQPLKWEQAMPIESGQADPYDAQVATDRDGNGWVAWSQNSGARNEVRARAYSASTASWADEQVIDGGSGTALQDSNGNVSSSPPLRLRVASNGFAAVTWLDDTPGIYRSGIPHVSILDPKSGTWTATLLSDQSATVFRAGVGEDGTVVVAWGSAMGLMVRSFSLGVWGNAVSLSTDQVSDLGDPAVDNMGLGTIIWGTATEVLTTRGRADSWDAIASLSNLTSAVSSARVVLTPSGCRRASISAGI